MALFLSVLMKSVTEVGIAYVEIMTKTINRVCSIPYACYSNIFRYFPKFKNVWLKYGMVNLRYGMIFKYVW